MKILMLNWKDMRHPQAGGAELLTHEIVKRIVKAGHEVIWLTAQPKGLPHQEIIDGYKVIRMGGKFSVYPKVMFYYLKNLRGWADLVIDQVNTIPFMAKFYVKERNIIFIHQLAREIWFYEMPKFIGWIGYLLEPIYLRLLSNKKTITVSNSSKKNLLSNGFKEKNISIISEGTEIQPVENLEIEKYSQPALLILGSIRSMKRTLHSVMAFEEAKKQMPELKLKIAGNADGSYGQMVLEYINNSEFKKDIEFLGKVSFEQKKQLMQKAHLLLVTSVKEGWGLVVTEANSQGTPAAVYNVDGLRDSVQNNITGIVTEKDPKALANGVVQLLKDKSNYDKLRAVAWSESKKITFEKAYEDFKLAAEIK
jgi:glycosyltransferase involved in cell wall biosynthesis